MCTKNLWRCTGEVHCVQGTKVPICYPTKGDKAYFMLVNDVDSEIYVKRLKQFGLAQRIPCGQCFQCKTLKAKEWAFRCMKEASKYDKNIMLTLTYDDDHLPKSDIVDVDTGEVFSTLRKNDVVLFMKRLRKKFGNGIRFLMCGEYGSDNEYVTWKGEIKRGTERPHYHILLFNFMPDDLEFYKWSRGEWSSEKYPLFKSKEMNELWTYGFVDCNEVTKETCEYVARYTTKKLYGDYAEAEYVEKGREKPFLNMSRAPGIGYDYFTDNTERLLNEEPMFLHGKKGLTKINTIRYYDKQIEKLYPEEFEKLKEKRLSRIEKHWDDVLSQTDLHEFEYIANQDIKSQSKQSRLKRVM